MYSLPYTLHHIDIYKKKHRKKLKNKIYNELINRAEFYKQKFVILVLISLLSRKKTVTVKYFRFLDIYFQKILNALKNLL